MYPADGLQRVHLIRRAINGGLYPGRAGKLFKGARSGTTAMSDVRAMAGKKLDEINNRFQNSRHFALNSAKLLKSGISCCSLVAVNRVGLLEFLSKRPHPPVTSHIVMGNVHSKLHFERQANEENYML